MPSAFCRANAAQALVNTLFGSSTVVSAIGLSADTVHPLLFGTLRAFVTSVLLLSCHAVSSAYTAWRTRGEPPLPRSATDDDDVPFQPVLRTLVTTDAARFFLMVLFLHTGNSFNLIGVQLAGAVTASLWQPSQPIFTMLAAAMLGTERVSMARVVGILLTVCGCMIMIAGSATSARASHNSRGALLGNVCLLINCLSTPLYIITSKPLVQRGYPPLLLAGACFCVNTCFFAGAFFVTRLIAATNPSGAAQFMCGTSETTHCVWAAPPAFGLLPRRAMLAVLYSAVFATALPQRLQLYANRFLRASLLSAYYALQPVATLVINYIIILSTPAPHFGLHGAHAADLGGLGVIVGLLIVVREEMLAHPAGDQEASCGPFKTEMHSLLSIPPVDVTPDVAELSDVEMSSVARRRGDKAEHMSINYDSGEDSAARRRSPLSVVHEEGAENGFGTSAHSNSDGGSSHDSYAREELKATSPHGPSEENRRAKSIP
ncbi:hypothetical protein AB1Y20_010017 [Prymnesium parvum]|uniref:EamA domain-containing protein n=1 Tax=Prymnesium parvum TaxID=97485 RepID=A0AB34K382_PRYPA